MHRAKGLEFDTVVLLGLAREPRPDDPRALQWLARATADGRDDVDHGAGGVRERRRRASGSRTSCGARNGSATRPNARGSCTSPRRAHASACTSFGSCRRTPKRRRRARCSRICGRSSRRHRATTPLRRAHDIEPNAIVPVLRRLVAPAAHERPIRQPTSACRRRARSSSGPAKPRRTSARSFTATCSASRSKGSSAGARNASVDTAGDVRARARAARRRARGARERRRRASSRRCRVRSPIRTAGGCWDRTRKRARSSG